MKVRSYLTALILVALIPMVLFSAVVVQQMIKAEREAVQQNMHELARASILAVDQELVYALAATQTLSASRRLDSEDFAGFYEQMKRANAGHNIEGALLDIDGRQIFNTAKPFGEKLPEPTPQIVRRVTDVFNGGKAVVSNLFTGRATGRHVVAVELPVTIQNGKRYLIDEWMDASHINSVLPAKGIAPSWLIAVFDRQGVTIARNKAFAEYVGTTPRKEIRDAMLQKVSESVVTISREGLPVYTALARSPITGWTAAVGVPLAEIESKAVRAVSLIAAGLGVALLCAVGGGLLLSQRMVRAINKVDEAARTLGQGGSLPYIDLNVYEMNQLQRSLNEVALQLRQSDAARLSHLVEAQDARRIAERHSSAKDEFLAMLGHELRNPLAAITSAVTLQNMLAPDSPGAARAREVIARQARQLSSLVDELLDAQRILTGKLQLNVVRCDAEQAVRDCMDAHAAQIASAGHTLSLEMEHVHVLADPTRFQQIVANLVDNAIKYTPHGGHISVRLSGRDGWVELAVSDSGVGMADDLRANVFELFVQGDVVNRQKGGLGIGLAVVKALAEQQGGTVSAASGGPGTGSTFIVRLPQASPVLEAGAILDQPASQALAIRVLLVEDNDDVRHMMSSLLESCGIDVVAAANGVQAVAAASDPRIAVALVDIDLPDMSGYEVAAAIHATREMKLIAVTGYGQPKDRELALASGFDMHLTKPVKVEDLVKALGTLQAA
jgi:signal transduction histidine kinase